MNKKIVALVASLMGIVSIAYLVTKSFKVLNNLDLNDPFEVDLDDE